MPLDAGPERKYNVEDQENVMPFTQPDSSAEAKPQSGTDAESIALLKEAGFDSLSEAQTKLDNLKLQKDQMILSLTERIKDRLFNNSHNAMAFRGVEYRINKLSRLVRVAKIGASREEVDAVPAKDNVIQVPESVWPGPKDLEKPDESEEEQQKVA
jgi:hypothetical protein